MYTFKYTVSTTGFPGGSVLKNLLANAGAVGFDPGQKERFPWRRKWKPFQYSCLGNSMDRGAWQAIVHAMAKASDRTYN